MSVFGSDAPPPPYDPYQPEHEAAPGPPSSSSLAPMPSESMPPAPPSPRFGRVGVVPWTLAQTVVGAAITLVPWVLLISLSQAAQASQPRHPKHLPVAQDAISGVIFILFTAVIEGAFLLAPAYFVFSHRASTATPRQRIYALGLRRTPLLPAIGWVVGGLLIIILVVGPLYDIFIKIFGFNLQTNVQTLMQEATYAPLTVLGTLIGSVFIAPFCEEIFFRGFLFGGLLRGMPFFAATLLAALLFAIAHGDIGSFLPLFAIGIILAVVRWRTGSLWPGMALHACNNGLAALTLLPLILH